MGMRILEYLSQTADYRLSMIPVKGNEPRVDIYTDASFSPYGGHSVTGVVIEFLGCPVLWKGKRQGLVSLSTAEAELISACEGTTLALSVEVLLLDIVEFLVTKMLLVDNTAAISLAEGSGSLRTRHLRVRSNFIRDLLERKDMLVEHCPGDIQVADALTKVLPGPRHATLCRLLGLGPETLVEQVASIVSRDRACSIPRQHTAQGLHASILVLTIVLQALDGVTAQEPEIEEPLNLDLYIVVVLMVLSVLFIWETGKHCLRMFCGRSLDDRPQIRMIRSDDEEPEDRRSRRQEAVRRAIEKETTELRLRRSQSNGERGRQSSQATVDVSVSLNPVPRPPEDPPVLSFKTSSEASGFCLSSSPALPVEVPSRGAASSSSSSFVVPARTNDGIQVTQKEIGVQTDFY